MVAVLTVCALAQPALERAVSLTREGRYAEARKAIEGVGEPSDIHRRIAFHRLKAAIASGAQRGSGSSRGDGRGPGAVARGCGIIAGDRRRGVAGRALR